MGVEERGEIVMEFFMIKEHPQLDLMMIQVDNTAIQLDREHQEKIYKILKKKFEKGGKL